MNIIPYVLESRKLPVPSHTMDLGDYDIIMTSLKAQKLFLIS